MPPRLTLYNVIIHKVWGGKPPPHGLMYCNIVWTHWVQLGVIIIIIIISVIIIIIIII